LIYDAIGQVFIAQGKIPEGNEFLNKAKEMGYRRLNPPKTKKSSESDNSK
jgi:hypothetical protein